MNSYLTLVKREFWEHRTAFVYLPLIAAIIATLLMVTALVLYKTDALNIIMEKQHISIHNNESSSRTITFSIQDEQEYERDAEQRKIEELEIARKEIARARDELNAINLPEEAVASAKRELDNQLRVIDEQLRVNLDENSNAVMTPPAPPTNLLAKPPEPPTSVDSTHKKIRKFPSSIETIGGVESEAFTQENIKIANDILKIIFVVFSTIMVLVTIYYLLSTLHNDRKDKSILFWKSLPVAEYENVLVKFAIALIALPTIATLASFVVGVVYAILGMMSIGMFSASTSAWDFFSGLDLFSISFRHWVTFFGVMLWGAPVLAWLILSSAIAKRSPFLVSVVPLIAIGIAEQLLFNTAFFVQTVLDRLPNLSVEDHDAGFLIFKEQGLNHLGNFITSVSLWIGLALAALQLYAAIWLRNHRYEI